MQNSNESLYKAIQALSKDELVIYTNELKKVKAEHVPQLAEKSKLLTTLIELVNGSYQSWLDKSILIEGALESEILRRVLAGKW